MRYIGLVLSILVFSPFAFATDDNTALIQTQNFMRDQTERDEYIKNHPDAKNADVVVERTVNNNPKAKNEMYGAAADIMGTLQKTSGGDTAKMQDQLDEGLKNPEKFIQSLPPEQQAQIRAIANEVGQRNAQANHNFKP